MSEAWSRIGVVSVGPTTAWADLTSASFESPVTRQPLPDGLRFYAVDPANFSETDGLYLQWKPGDGESPGNALYVPPQSAIEGARVHPEGLAVTTISYYGDGTSGAAQIVAYFVG